MSSTDVIDQNKASRLARDGFDLWQAGNLEESVAKYQQALLLADPNHFALADYDGEFRRCTRNPWPRHRGFGAVSSGS
jgi:hypothetical protein